MPFLSQAKRDGRILLNWDTLWSSKPRVGAGAKPPQGSLIARLGSPLSTEETVSKQKNPSNISNSVSFILRRKWFHKVISL